MSKNTKYKLIARNLVTGKEHTAGFYQFKSDCFEDLKELLINHPECAYAVQFPGLVIQQIHFVSNSEDLRIFYHQ